jgi:hypothetical protein
VIIALVIDNVPEVVVIDSEPVVTEPPLKAAAVVADPAEVAFPDKAPTNVVAVTIPADEEEIPLSKFVAVVAVVVVPAEVAVVAFPCKAPTNVVAVTIPADEEEVPLLKFVAVVAVAAFPEIVVTPVMVAGKAKEGPEIVVTPANVDPEVVMVPPLKFTAEPLTFP